MKKIYIVFLATIFFSNLYSQNNFWSKTTEERVFHLEKLDRKSEAIKYDIYTLDFESIKISLSEATNRELGIESNLILEFPSSNGKIQNYRIYEAPVLHRSLSENHPDIKSYVGIGIDDKTATIRFSTTIFGFHGMIFSGKTQTTYIDPYTTDLNNYIVYSKKNIISENSFACLTDGIEAEASPGVHFSPFNIENEMLDGSLRKFRLALAGNRQYCDYHINAAGFGSGTIIQKRGAVLAAMNITMTRVNGIYERDLSVTMEIIPTNEDILFIDNNTLPNNTGQLYNQIQGVINNAIGFSNYDIGHVFSTSAGGVAALGSVCTNSKARGVTGSPNPVGDPYDIDYVAHEMGHQFGANHTFNNSCSGNRNNSTAVEPGSGSTIMAYAGICPPNVQGNSSSYFHVISLAEMRSFLLGWGNCSQNISNGNTKPTINPLNNYTIPRGTAFILKGNGNDQDGDGLTFCWEQTNQQISTQPPTATNTSGPLFRSLSPSDSPDRYMPPLANVLQGNLTPTWEVVPSIGRTMNFALTVRDNNPNGGEYARANMTVTTSGSSGPFVVTSQNSTVNWEADSNQTITWNVAGTTSSPINTSNVNILLSVNGGMSFDYVLASNTPNDGTETITVPNVSTSNARIMVEAVGNIFYAVNTSTFSIGDCSSFVNSTSVSIPDGTGNNQAGPALTSTLNITDDITIDNLKVGLNINHTWNGDLIVRLEHPNGTQILLWNRTCNNPQTSGIGVVFEAGAPAIVCSNPVTGTYSPVGNLSTLNGLSSQGEWKLIITDNYTEDTGTLMSWSLDFGCATASIDDLNLTNFKLYPNPNKGNFTIEFDSDSSENIHISIYDLNGRKVFNQSVQNTGRINQSINTNNLQTGMYLVKIEDGKKEITEKIIIQ